MDKPVQFTDVLEAIQMGIVTLKTGYNSHDEKPTLAINIKEGYAVTDEFLDVMRCHDIDLFILTKHKEDPSDSLATWYLRDKGLLEMIEKIEQWDDERTNHARL